MKIKEQQLHEHGFVRFIDIMGGDGDISDAARVSYGKGTRSISDNRNLIRYLVRHKHTSPLEMVEVKFHLKLPIFVMRQLVRHRTASLNEYSGRYSIMSDDCYEPSDEYLKPQSQTNKQGRAGDLIDSWKHSYKQRMHDITNKARFAYKFLIGNDTLSHGGLARELARTVLPVSNYTECYWKMDLHNFFHFCQLRMDDHAQQEIQDYARCMYEMVKPEVPIASEAFEDYIYNSVNLSKMELNALKCAVSTNMLQHTSDMSKREWKEFLEKFE